MRSNPLKKHEEHARRSNSSFVKNAWKPRKKKCEMNVREEKYETHPATSNNNYANYIF